MSASSYSSTYVPDVPSVADDPYAHARPEIRDPINLMMRGRDMTLYYPLNFQHKSGEEIMHWIKAALFSVDGEGVERVEWGKASVHCFYVTAVFTVMFLLLRSVVFWILDGHARRVVRDPKEDRLNELSPCEVTALAKAKDLLVKKYKKYIWHGTAYAFMLVWGVRILFLAPWSAVNQLTFDYMSLGWPHHSDIENPEYSALMEEFQIFTQVQLSWYLAGGVENLIHDRSRNDFFMMLLHHFLTILLIYGAFVADGHRCAVHITVTLDVGDIAMYYCKSYHLRTSSFDGKARPGYSVRHLLHLAGLTVIWIVTRLYFYGLETVTIWMHNPWTPNPPFVCSYLKIFLALLWLLQFMWGVALTKMVIDQARKGEFVDNVSGDTGTIKKMERELKAKTSPTEQLSEVSSNVGDVGGETTPEDSSDDAEKEGDGPAIEMSPSVRRRM